MKSTKRAQAELIDLRLNAALAPSRSAGVFGLSPEGEERARHQREFSEMQAEEARDERKKTMASPYFKTLRDQYSKSVAELMKIKTYAISTLFDPSCDLPLAEVGSIDFNKAEENYKELIPILETQGITLSETAAQKVLVYLAVNGECTRVIDGKSYQVDGSQMTAFVRAARRLNELGVFTADEYVEVLPQEPTVEPFDPPADDMLQRAHAQFFQMFEETWNAWLQSLRDYFGLELTLAQKEKALTLLERLGCAPTAWDECRITLSKANIIPYSLTPLEILGERYSQGKMSREDFVRESNAIRFNVGSITHEPPSPA